MPTPLFPPPTPLLSALPPPNQTINPPINQSINQSVRRWEAANTTPQLSSSAPAELPSFQLEASAKRAKQSNNQSNKSGISLLSSSLVFADDSVEQASQQSVDQSNGLPLLAAALQKQRNQTVDQPIIQSNNQPTKAIKSTLVHSASITQSLSQSTYQSSHHLAAQSHMAHSQSFSVDSNSSSDTLDLRSVSQSANLSANQSTPFPSRTLTQAVKPFNQSIKPFDNRSMARLTSISDLLKIVCPDHPISQPINPSMTQAGSQPLIVIDLDDTVYCQYHSPCAMMTEQGLARYSQLINQSADYAHLSFAAKTSLTRSLQAAVSRKRGVERATIQSIKQMQARGVSMIALTARFTSMVSTTRMECASLGIDLSLNSPFDSFVRDHASSAVLVEGIIYTNAQEKGPILNRFLAQLWAPYLRDQTISRVIHQSISSPPSPPLSSISVPIPIRQTASQTNHPSMDQSHLSTSLPASNHSIASLNQSISPIIFRTSKRLKHKKLRFKFDDMTSTVDEIHASHLDVKRQGGFGNSLGQSSPPYMSLPSKILFVDDRLQNCVSVMNGLKVAQQLNISLACYHYTPDKFDSNSDDESDDEHSFVRRASRGSGDDSEEESGDELERKQRALAEYQIRHFISHQIVLTDREARKHRAVASPTRGSHNASPHSNSMTRDHEHMCEEGGSLIGML